MPLNVSLQFVEFWYLANLLLVGLVVCFTSAS